MVSRKIILLLRSYSNANVKTKVKICNNIIYVGSEIAKKPGVPLEYG
jgi:hypothetical protein